MEQKNIDYFVELDIIITEIHTAFEKKCPVNWVYEEKNGRPTHGIVFVKDGRAEYQFEKDFFIAEKEDIVLLGKGSKYVTRGDAQNPYHFIVISFQASDPLLLQPLMGKRIVKAGNPQVVSSLFHDLSRLWFYKGIAYKMKCRALLADILYQLVRQSIQEEMHLKNYSRIQTAVSYMERYYDHDFSLEELSEMSRLSPSHFRRLFKEIYRMTPVEYLNYIRVNKAKDLILSEMYTIGEIAEKTGYPSIYYFSRVFKKYTGTAPSHYRISTE